MNNHLRIQKKTNIIEVYFKANQEDIDTMLRLNITDFSKERLLLIIDFQQNIITTFPLITRPGNSFLEPKHAAITCISVEDPSLLDSPLIINKEHDYDLESILNTLPKGFIKDYNFGLGIQKDYRFILNQIRKIDDVDHLHISYSKETQKNGTSYILNYSHYSSLIKGIDAIHRFHRKETLEAKDLLTYNSLLHELDPNIFHEKTKIYPQNTLFKIISQGSPKKNSFSKNDISSSLSLMQKNTESIYQNNKNEVFKFINTMELVNLNMLIKKIEEKIMLNLNEAYWQKLFTDNPFILSLVFDFPVIKIHEQISVGGRTLNGANTKISDFCLKNVLTHNIALVEIKKPQTELLSKKEYRGNIFSPTQELSGSMNQILDQKFHFQQEFTQLKANSEINNLDNFHLNCILVIGKIPKEKNKKKSFELYRNNSKEVTIITFDELLEKLKNLYYFLEISSND